MKDPDHALTTRPLRGSHGSDLWVEQMSTVDIDAEAKYFSTRLQQPL